MPEQKNKAIAEMNLHEKLLKIADAAGVLQKTKEGFNYKYVPEEDILAKVTAGMQLYRVMLYHSIVPGTTRIQPHTYEKVKYVKNEKKETERQVTPVNEIIITADSLFTWVNVDKPDERIEVPWILAGQMEDVSQAFGAACTYGNRYFLMKSLQLATTEADPDAYRSKQRVTEQYGEEKEAKETLRKAIQEVVEAGTKAIASGIKREKIKEVIAKLNEGNPNPRSIKTINVCRAVMVEFAALKSEKTDAAPPQKKETKEAKK
ncbi:MAG: ERF family protein [Firmicutes bacterium]|nr:ERF family protein [Bacillota bacterium]